jgi:hemerythrin-like domain-containing protein
LQLSTPKSILRDHQELHQELERFASEQSVIGKFSQSLIKLLEQHIKKEEEFALPPLSLLTQLYVFHDNIDMSEGAAMAKKLKHCYQYMLNDHKKITQQLEKLKEEASNINREDIIKAIEKLLAHIQLEEEVLYPTTIVIGKYIKLYCLRKKIEEIDNNPQKIIDTIT